LHKNLAASKMGCKRGFVNSFMTMEIPKKPATGKKEN